MDKDRKMVAIAFLLVVIAVGVVSIVGVWLSSQSPLVLQGEIEAEEVDISGILPGRVDSLWVKEGDRVGRGDTLIYIHSLELLAKHKQAAAISAAADYQSKMVDEGTRRQIIEEAKQLWKKASADLNLARTTYERIEKLFEENVVTSQRRDEVFALYQSAQADERAAYQQYNMALEGARVQEKKSARSLFDASEGAVEEVDAYLKDAFLTSPKEGEISAVYPKRGELAEAGAPLMSLTVLEDIYMVLNVREDLLPHFAMGDTLQGDVPAVAATGLPFRIYYMAPLGSYATWKSTRQAGSYDMKTFEIRARSLSKREGLRPGMSVMISLQGVGR